MRFNDRTSMGTCICPPETEGTHCEKLKLTKVQEQATESNFKPETDSAKTYPKETMPPNRDSTTKVWIGVSSAVALASVITLSIFAYRKKQRFKNSSNADDIYLLDPVA